ncbi:prepilin-type N-terminal cleavage/methylation domain-containing protein [Pseudomonas putida]|uniref:prepilin-type N-terminal cleavage/methylation domain-containing protein n=1 Tax=Pseudomonas putida TaxID=303 RepID=UPI001E433D2E|nr:prepilin-type N-terminal cleavage/methylation domain-containing protein [Pseudomonas putida]MCE0975426.1 prepilin-type N-terminal cleavage/methylation domain-containing protein [Pseudomonas putida]
MHARQRGMTLMEVLLAVVVVAVGMFATASIQLQALQALQAADSARRDGQAAMAAHSELERRR